MVATHPAECKSLKLAAPAIALLYSQMLKYTVFDRARPGPSLARLIEVKEPRSAGR